MQAHICPSNPNLKEEHKREGHCGFCFPPIGFYNEGFKEFMTRSVLIPGLDTVRHRLEGKVKRCMGEFALVTMLPHFFSMLFRGFNAGDQENVQGDRNAFTCLDAVLSR